MQTTIRIVDYDPRWLERFDHHHKAIARVLGERALRIEHIGSTSVPELAAKPIVDILLVVADSADEESYATQLESAGYQLRIREPEFHEHRLFKPSADDVNLHVFTTGSPEIERYLLFRDRLRVNTADRLRYEVVKRQLATRSWDNVDAYATAKTQIVEEIIAAARAARPGRNDETESEGMVPEEYHRAQNGPGGPSGKVSS